MIGIKDSMNLNDLNWELNSFGKKTPELKQVFCTVNWLASVFCSFLIKASEELMVWYIHYQSHQLGSCWHQNIYNVCWCPLEMKNSYFYSMSFLFNGSWCCLLKIICRDKIHIHFKSIIDIIFFHWSLVSIQIASSPPEY